MEVKEFGDSAVIFSNGKSLPFEKIACIFGSNQREKEGVLVRLSKACDGLPERLFIEDVRLDDFRDILPEGTFLDILADAGDEWDEDVQPYLLMTSAIREYRKEDGSIVLINFDYAEQEFCCGVYSISPVQLSVDHLSYLEKHFSPFQGSDLDWYVPNP